MFNLLITVLTAFFVGSRIWDLIPDVYQNKATLETEIKQEHIDWTSEL